MYAYIRICPFTGTGITRTMQDARDAKELKENKAQSLDRDSKSNHQVASFVAADEAVELKQEVCEYVGMWVYTYNFPS